MVSHRVRESALAAFDRVYPPSVQSGGAEIVKSDERRRAEDDRDEQQNGVYDPRMGQGHFGGR
jgi:hypothetical protein